MTAILWAEKHFMGKKDRVPVFAVKYLEVKGLVFCSQNFSRKNLKIGEKKVNWVSGKMGSVRVIRKISL
jgi:hypothetical protein